MLDDVNRAKIVITNYHAFKLRERIELSKGGRALLQGRVGEELDTQETEGQMLQRVMPELMGLKNILVLNDEAHHCYREKADDEDEEEDLKGDDRKEAERNREAARLWISGLEAVNRMLGLARVIDLSATPFFLRGSGYAEGTLFPWTMSDFSLMDAIECGIVKLPRVPVAENIPGTEMPMFRNLWENIRKDMPRKGRGKAEGLDPLALPVRLQTALAALYGHQAPANAWGVRVPTSYASASGQPPSPPPRTSSPTPRACRPCGACRPRRQAPSRCATRRRTGSPSAPSPGSAAPDTRSHTPGRPRELRSRVLLR
jgi:type III restriction enzyme